ncbi:hypothetical protein HPB47_017930 [Ixodes persulcatus]|uniref:Uncharacterized protein n=1 Tax=Ixodes persulcatus TaxID=34615 RepID=A0AC60QPM5_IXOPE|nr:hypothetical protein HPB47_017930 [Ixodes persulcatus]
MLPVVYAYAHMDAILFKLSNGCPVEGMEVVPQNPDHVVKPPLREPSGSVPSRRRKFQEVDDATVTLSKRVKCTVDSPLRKQSPSRTRS